MIITAGAISSRCGSKSFTFKSVISVGQPRRKEGAVGVPQGLDSFFSVAMVFGSIDGDGVLSKGFAVAIVFGRGFCSFQHLEQQSPVAGFPLKTKDNVKKTVRKNMMKIREIKTVPFNYLVMDEVHQMPKTTVI